jgi:hypothetical protein
LALRRGVVIGMTLGIRQWRIGAGCAGRWTTRPRFENGRRDEGVSATSLKDVLGAAIIDSKLEAVYFLHRSARFVLWRAVRGVY